MTSDKKTEKKEPVEHVHGPNCNHGHHHEKQMPDVNDGPKVGRNAPCLCGSQKKFKKCCGK